MWLDPFSDDLRRGVEEVRGTMDRRELADAATAHRALAGHTVASLVRAVRDASLDLSEQDAIWRSVVRCYQTRDSRLWAPVLLELLAPAIINEAYRLVRQLPAAEADEVRQELLAAVLTVAGTMALRPGRRFIKLGLMREARRRARRALMREIDRPDVSLEALVERFGSDTFALTDAGLQRGRVPVPEDLRREAELVIRIDFHGYAPAEVASMLGISRDAVESRVFRARRRLRRLLAA